MGLLNCPRNSLFLELTCFLHCLPAGMFPVQLGESVREGLTDSIQRYHSDNSTKAAWDSIQKFVSADGPRPSSTLTSFSNLGPWRLKGTSCPGSFRI